MGFIGAANGIGLVVMTIVLCMYVWIGCIYWMDGLYVCIGLDWMYVCMYVFNVCMYLGWASYRRFAE